MHDESDLARNMRSASPTVLRSEPLFSVPDMRHTVRWYASIGFTIADEDEDSGELVFARVSFGGATFALSPGGTSGPRDVRLWLFTSDVERLYNTLGNSSHSHIQFEEELYDPFYGGR